MWFHRDRRVSNGCGACGCETWEGEHLLGHQSDGTYRVRTRRCPTRIVGDPVVASALHWHRLTSFHHHLPLDGGLVDQDALLLDALTVLAAEVTHIEAADMRERTKNGR